LNEPQPNEPKLSSLLALRWPSQFIGYEGEESPVEVTGFSAERLRRVQPCVPAPLAWHRHLATSTGFTPHPPHSPLHGLNRPRNRVKLVELMPRDALAWLVPMGGSHLAAQLRPLVV